MTPGRGRFVVFLTCLPLGAGATALQAQDADASHPVRHKYQVVLEVGPVATGALGFAARIQDSPFLLGVMGGFAFEWNENNFEPNIWDVVHLDAFGRFQHDDFLQVEAGFSVLGFSPFDDTDLRGIFFGSYTAVLFGFRYVFFGMALRAGTASLEGESEFGTILSPRVRVVIPLGRQG